MKKIILVLHSIILAFLLKAQERPAFNSDYFLRPKEDPYQKIRENLFMKLTVNKKNCFVGEPVLASFKLYSRLESRSDIVKNPGFYGFTVYDMINLNDEKVETEFVNGRQFDVHTIRSVQLYPLREGIFSIDPMEVKNFVEFSRSAVNKKTEQEIVEGMLKNDSNEVKDNGSEIFESSISTEPVAITVKPHPVKFKPAAFSGATGIFNISANVIKNTLKKNEENTLEITISGKGNFIQINAPTIEWPKGIEGFEPVVKDILDKTQVPLSGKRTFQYAFISAQPGDYIIPAIRFSFFDPDSGKYRTIANSDIKITITNEEKNQSFIPEITQKNRGAGNKYLFIVAGVLLLILIGFFLIKRKKEQNLNYLTAVQSVKSLSINEFLPPSLLSELVEDKAFYNSVHQSVWKFFSYHFNLSGSEMNKENLFRKLKEKKIGQNLINDVLQILQQCETGMFTNVSTINNRDALFLKTQALFGEVSKAILSGSE